MLGYRNPFYFAYWSYILQPGDPLSSNNLSVGPLGFSLQVVLFLSVKSLLFPLYYCMTRTSDSNWVKTGMVDILLYWWNLLLGYNLKESIWIFHSFLFLYFFLMHFL